MAEQLDSRSGEFKCCVLVHGKKRLQRKMIKDYYWTVAEENIGVFSLDYKRRLVKEVFHALKIFKATQFAEELKQSGILNAIISKKTATKELTIFAPSKFEPSNIMGDMMMKDSGHRRKILMNHFAKGMLTLEELRKKKEFYTLPANDRVRITCFADVCAANQARITRPSVEGKYTIVHLVDRAILPPMGNIWDFLEQHGYVLELKYFKRLVEYAEMVPQLKRRGPMVLFAPTNKALGRLPISAYRDIILSPAAAATFIRKHIVRARFPLSLMKSTFAYRFRTMGNTVIRLAKTSSGKVSVSGNGNRKYIKDIDIVTSNGFVNIIDHVLLPVKK